MKKKWKTKCKGKIIKHGERGTRIGKVGSKKWRSYCSRSAGQLKKYPKSARDPCSPLVLSRKKWRC